MIRVFDFVCANGHRTEMFVDQKTTGIACPVCSEPAGRVISAPRAQLEGITGAFPSAADAWERRRESHMNKEQRMMRDHGTYANGRPVTW